MQNFKLHDNVKSIGLIAKKSAEIGALIDKITKILKAKNIEILIEKNSADFFGKAGFGLNEILKKTEILISLGGDGTLISIAGKVANQNAFIIGIHAGTLGFLTDILPDDFEKFLDEFLRGEYEIERPFMLEVLFEKNSGEIVRKLAFNDVVLNRNNIASMAKIDAYLNRKYFNTYFGDGVIISSAVGSTAYNMSANGPIIYPLSDVFCITPICSHSLTQRPLIVPKEYFVNFKTKSDVSAIVDGQDIFNMNEFKNIGVRVNKARSSLIRRVNHDYFGILREKLSWGK